MYIEALTPSKKKEWKAFLEAFELKPDESISETILIYDDEKLVATGSRYENILKCIAVSPEKQGEDLTSKIISSLRQSAFSQGYSHLFLYTKPQYKNIFSSLFFYEIARTDKVLLMENREKAINKFLDNIKEETAEGIIGACVMNCNPFTNGHRYLIETASKQCDRLYVFVLSEDKSMFSFKDRLEMVKLGTADIKNVTVAETGPYLISSATFPTYFLKERDNKEEIHCLLDIEIFSKYFGKELNISKRFVGTEPLSPLTHSYNQALKKYLPQNGIEVVEIPRIEYDSLPISASKVRELFLSKKFKELEKEVPKTTYDYITKEDFICRKDKEVTD